MNALEIYSFGMLMPGRSHNADESRFLYHGMEQDPEIIGDSIKVIIIKGDTNKHENARVRVGFSHWGRKFEKEVDYDTKR